MPSLTSSVKKQEIYETYTYAEFIKKFQLKKSKKVKVTTKGGVVIKIEFVYT